MGGLRTIESEKIIKYFSIVQSYAYTLGKVFFLDSGEGYEIITDELDGENISGWLVPLKKSSEFETLWKNRDEDATEDWDKYYCFAE